MIPAIFGVGGTALSDAERSFLKDVQPVGYILFGRNCENRDQVRALTDSLRELHGRDDLIVSIDQEGGRVQRMKAPEWRAYPAGAAFDRLYEAAPASAMQAARLNAEALALDLAEVGINVNFHAPFDVRREETDDVIGDRALGHDPMRVAALGRAVLAGHAAAGVAGCLKHMPGHGRATADSHKSLPVVTASAEELEDDIAPFQALRDAPVGMTSHILFTAWDETRPATLSPTIINDIIRTKIGFTGLLLTDDIDMQALDGTVPERAERAIAAGCDVVLNCWAKLDDMEQMARRLPPLSDDGLMRLELALKGTGSTAQAGEAGELLAERDALFEAAGVAV